MRDWFAIAYGMLLALAANENLYLEGLDVSNAYLYGDLNVPIIMDQPTNSSQIPARPGHACKLHKYIYGAKQAGETWGSLWASLRETGGSAAHDMTKEFTSSSKKTSISPEKLWLTTLRSHPTLFVL